jgi:hypothetical protein
MICTYWHISRANYTFVSFKIIRIKRAIKFKNKS